MSLQDYIDGLVEVSINEWPQTHDPGISIAGIDAGFFHIGPTDSGTHLYYFRAARQRFSHEELGKVVKRYFIGNYSDLVKANHDFMKFAFYADIERRNTGGGRSRISIPIFCLQHGDKMVSDFGPRGVFMGDTDIPKLNHFDAILQSVGISENNKKTEGHIFDEIIYFVVSGFSPDLSSNSPIEMGSGIFWVPASQMPTEVAAHWGYGHEAELSISGAFAVNARGMYDSFGIGQSKKYFKIKISISEYLAVCSLVRNITPILTFTWAKYFRENPAQIEGFVERDMRVYDCRNYGVKLYPEIYFEISKELRGSLSFVLNMDRNSKAHRPTTGFLRALESAMRTVDPIIGFPTLWAGLESILRPGKAEIAYKLAVAIAELVGGNKKFETFRAVKEGYSLRSDIVHGNVFDESDVFEYGSRAIEYCRSALLYLVRGNFSADQLNSLSVEALVEKLLTTSKPLSAPLEAESAASSTR